MNRKKSTLKTSGEHNHVVRSFVESLETVRAHLGEYRRMGHRTEYALAMQSYRDLVDEFTSALERNASHSSRSNNHLTTEVFRAMTRSVSHYGNKLAKMGQEGQGNGYVGVTNLVIGRIK